MNWFVLAAAAAWLVALIMLIVAPIEFRRQASFGEDAPRLVAQVVAHHQGVAIPGSPGQYYTAVEVEWPASAERESGRKVIYDFEPAPPIGEVVVLAMPDGLTDSAGVPIPRSQRTRWLVRHIALCGLVAGLGVVFVLAARATAPLWLRWAPPMVLSLGVSALGAMSAQTASDDEHAQMSGMRAINGRVIHVETCGTRSLGGRATAPLYCVEVEYHVAGERFVSRRSGWWNAPVPGQELVVRVAPERPDFAIVEEEKLTEISARIGYALALTGLIGAVVFLAVWIHAARLAAQTG